jgi:hypothetical protein
VDAPPFTAGYGDLKDMPCFVDVQYGCAEQNSYYPVGENPTCGKVSRHIRTEPARVLVTGCCEVRGMGYWAATQVKIPAPEIHLVSEVDVFHLTEDSTFISNSRSLILFSSKLSEITPSLVVDLLYGVASRST